MIAAVELRTDPTPVQLPAAAEPEHAGALREPEEPSGHLRGGLRGRAGRLDAHQHRASSPVGRARTGSQDTRCRAAARARRPSARTPTGQLRRRRRRHLRRHAPREPGDQAAGRGDPQPAADLRALRRDGAGWDGGNVKISINGGAYALVPASAFTFNPYNATLETAAAGQHQPARRPARLHAARTAARSTAAGAQSQIDLTSSASMPGDTIRLRFDFGMDGCTRHRRLVRRQRPGDGLRSRQEAHSTGDGPAKRTEAEAQGRTGARLSPARFALAAGHGSDRGVSQSRDTIMFDEMPSGERCVHETFLALSRAWLCSP